MAEVLIVDNRAAMGNTPGLHALVIGIGRYPGLPEVGQQGKPHQFGLTSVDGPAVAAWRLSQTLQTPPTSASWRQPLKTLRLLISPTTADLSRVPKLVTAPAVLPNVAAVNDAAAAWREDCEKTEDEVALFYFTGHGLLHEGEDCLACADFGLSSAPGNVTLRGSFTLDSLLGALAGPRPGGWPIARRQFWFVDACRIRTSGATEGKIGSAEELLNQREEDGTPMERAGLLGTMPGGPSNTDPALGSTAFTEALLWALGGAVAETVLWPPDSPTGFRWPITMNALLQACRTALARNPHNRGQLPVLYGFGGSEPLLLLASPPEFSARILVKPPRQSSEITGWSLVRSEGEPPAARQERQFPADPLPLSLHAGHYSVVVNIGDKVQHRVWFACLGNDELSLWW